MTVNAETLHFGGFWVFFLMQKPVWFVHAAQPKVLTRHPELFIFQARLIVLKAPQARVGL